MVNILFHPLTTFIAGVLLTLVALGIFFVVSSPPNQTEEMVKTYNDAVAKSGGDDAAPDQVEGLERFTGFLQGIGSLDFVKEQTAKVYSKDAFLNDTLVTHHGLEEIEAYFLETAKTMTSFEVKIDDTARSGSDYYVRWTMIFAAPALAKGTVVHSVGMSQVRFDGEGKVAFHQDFWDSGSYFYAQLPVSGVVLETIRKRLQ